MARQIKTGTAKLEPTRSKPPLLRRAAASLVLIAIAVLVIHLAIGLVMAVFWIVVVVAAIVAALWAFNTLF